MTKLHSYTVFALRVADLLTHAPLAHAHVAHHLVVTMHLVLHVFLAVLWNRLLLRGVLRREAVLRHASHDLQDTLLHVTFFFVKIDVPSDVMPTETQPNIYFT